MSAIYIGIDPGLTGAIAVIRENGATVTDLQSIDGQLDLKQLRAEMFIAKVQHQEEVYIVIEDVHSMPDQGVASSFKLGRTYGRIEGLVYYFAQIWDGLIIYVSPQRWKNSFGLINKRPKGSPKLTKAESEKRRREGKTRARELAAEIFPGIAESVARVKDDGRADALLLAEWGRRNA